MSDEAEIDDWSAEQERIMDNWDTASDEERILAMYGGPERMKQLVCLTHQQIADIHRARIHKYLSWPNVPEPRRERWRQDLQELDDWERENC